MQEVFEKITEKLKEKSYEIRLNGSIVDSAKKVVELSDIADIVNQIAAEYNDGWILCSERLPEEHDSVFARFKGTDQWRDSMFEKTSSEVHVTISNEKGYRATTHAHTTDGTWRCDALKFSPTYRVIAWQPLPAPYQPKRERKA